MSQQKKKSELIHFIHFCKWHRLFLSMEIKMESYQDTILFKEHKF